MGRETLAAIEEELANGAPIIVRDKVDTVRYEERPRLPPSRAPFHSTSPELITISETPIGRATQEAIDEHLAHEAFAAALAPPKSHRHVRPGASKVFEISIFVVEGEEITTKASEQMRRDFVEQRLLHRVPALSMDDVVRISVSPTVAPNTVIVRVWSMVGTPG